MAVMDWRVSDSPHGFTRLFNFRKKTARLSDCVNRNAYRISVFLLWPRRFQIDSIRWNLNDNTQPSTGVILKIVFSHDAVSVWMRLTASTVAKVPSSAQWSSGHHLSFLCFVKILAVSSLRKIGLMRIDRRLLENFRCGRTVEWQLPPKTHARQNSGRALSFWYNVGLKRF